MKKRLVIISSYVAGETYGLLGPQMAATVIQENSGYECIVIALAREDDKALLKKVLCDYFGKERPIIGFSTLSGREDLFSLAGELKDEGAFTILAGPQADMDYVGEVDWEHHDNRFKGLSRNFSLAIHGPAEQALILLGDFEGDDWKKAPGLLHVGQNGAAIRNPKKAWEERFLRRVHWDNIYMIGESGLVPLKVTTGQVVQQIGCPYAAQSTWAEIDYPAFLVRTHTANVRIPVRGCSFCDVAADKGFYGALIMDTVLSQIDCIPEAGDGRKIPFELINENPLPGLQRLLRKVNERGLGLSQINLILRADWFLKGEGHLRGALKLAGDMGVRIVLTSIGIETFDDRILRNLNKGLKVETNLRAIRLMRQLKGEFPETWGYSRSEGAIHGFIHPTPWDTDETRANVKRVILQYRLAPDILPDHSIPLIIHHASGLGAWIREIEMKEGCRFHRLGSIIEWWQVNTRAR
jgi:hypothetical protein